MPTTKTFPVRFEQPAAGTHASAMARDVSLGGMFVVTSSPPDEGTLLVIELDLEGIKVNVDARVLRREPDGMAVVFIDLPDDVAATLSAAVTPTSARTILGVGSANIKATTPGIAVPPSEPRVPIAVPSVEATTPGIAVPAEAKAEAKTTKPIKKEVPKEPEPQEEEEEPEPPRRGSGGRWFVLLLLAGAGAAAYVYREPLRREIESALGPAPTIAPIASTAPTASTPESGAPIPPTADAATTAPGDAALDATTDAASDASTADASAKDAGSGDGGHHDAGVRDAGQRDAGQRDAGQREAGTHK